jgi:uncharacterized membrane protein
VSKGRLEAFSDGVFAIIITIMVLDLRAPASPDLHALKPLTPIFLSYTLSFAFVAIYWNNHHHMLQASKHVNGAVLWANIHLLFWLSLVPFVTDWMGTNHFATWPVATYGMVLLLAGAAYFILSRALIDLHGSTSLLAEALGRDSKGRVSLIAYMVAIPLAFSNARLSCGIYVLVAILWLVPDRRIEKNLKTTSE